MDRGPGQIAGAWNQHPDFLILHPRQYAHRIKQLLESDPALVGEPGSSYEGKLIFPWGYGAVLSNISRRAFEAADLGNIIPAGRVICQDEMTETVEPEAFQKRLWDMFSVSFKCLLTLPQVDRVRWHLFPEIRVSQGTFDLGSPSAPKVETVPDIVRVHSRCGWHNRRPSWPAFSIPTSPRFRSSAAATA